MTQYKHRLTLSVPEALIPAANQLALIMGESSADANTFTQAGWQDAQDNLYAICSAVSKPIVLGALQTGLPDPLPAHAEGADTALAQQALDALVIYQPGDEETPATQAAHGVIVLAIDHDPLTALAAMGLTRVEVLDE
jgi:hypothetical protein